MGVVFGRLYDIAAVLADLWGGFRGLRAGVVRLRLAAFHTVGALVSVTLRICNLRLRTPPMILRVAVGATEPALVEMVRKAAIGFDCNRAGPYIPCLRHCNAQIHMFDDLIIWLSNGLKKHPILTLFRLKSREKRP